MITYIRVSEITKLNMTVRNPVSRKSNSLIWEEVGRCKDSEKGDQEIRTWSIQYSHPVTDDVWGYLQGSTTLDHCSLNYGNKSCLSFCQCHTNQTLF